MDVKTGGNLDENQNKKRFLSHFSAIFVGILDGGESKRKRFDFFSRKICLLVHIETYGSGVWAVVF